MSPSSDGDLDGAPGRPPVPGTDGNGGTGSKTKLGARVCSAIEAEIVERGWPIGEILGSGADLERRFGVSRPVIREAVRLLEAHQVASMRKGPNGGLVVTEPQAGAIVETVALYFSYKDVSTHDILQTRSVLELTCVEMATANLDEIGVARLRSLLEAERRLGPERMHVHSHDFHVAIAELSGSEAMQLFTQVLTVLSRDRAKLPATVDREAEDVYYAHSRIADAMIAGDASLARHRMLRHLEAAAEYQP